MAVAGSLNRTGAPLVGVRAAVCVQDVRGAGQKPLVQSLCRCVVDASFASVFFLPRR